jgi:hypothetical protein
MPSDHSNLNSQGKGGPLNLTKWIGFLGIQLVPQSLICGHSIKLKLGGWHSSMHYKLQHWPILYNILQSNLNFKLFAIFTFHLSSCNQYLHFLCKSHCHKHLKWWKHYSQNDFKSSLLLSFMCERKKIKFTKNALTFSYKKPPTNCKISKV